MLRTLSSPLVLLTTGICFAASVQNPREAVPVKRDIIEVPGKLTTKDAHDSKLRQSPAQWFRVKFQAGKTYSIDLTSPDDAFDPYLRLEDAHGKELAYNDDNGHDLNARIEFRAEQDGTYKIVATSLDGKGGKFLLVVQEAQVPRLPKLAPKLSQPPALGKPTAIVLRAGVARVDGELTNEDGTDPQRPIARAKAFEVRLQAGKTYEIEMRSKSLDSYLRLEGADGKRLASDDDSGGDLDASIVFACSADGNYRILTTTFGGGTGAFSLTIREKR